MTRPFRSGVLVVGDRDDRDLPGCGPDRSIGVGLSSITVPVRYAAATQGSEEPLAVTVSCDYFPDRPSADGFEAVIEVPTGVLVVGDVDASESLTLAPGLCASL
jgi:hypothetical protein